MTSAPFAFAKDIKTSQSRLHRSIINVSIEKPMVIRGLTAATLDSDFSFFSVQPERISEPTIKNLMIALYFFDIAALYLY